MPWVRFDDQYPIHRKVKPLSDSEMRFHIEAIFWCARNLTDGFVPAEDVSDVSAIRRPHKIIPRLVARGLLHEAGYICDSPKCPPAPGGEGWVLHDYWDYQPSKEKVLAEREAKRKRQERWLAKRNGRRDASQDASRDAAPPRPAPKEAGRVPRSTARRREDGGGGARQVAPRTPAQAAAAAKRAAIARCPLCDEHGYLPNGRTCPHDPTRIEATSSGIQAARAAIRRRPPQEDPK